TDTNIFYESGSPVEVRAVWNNTVKAMQAKNWPVAERQLKTITQKAPRWAPGWSALGFVLLSQHKSADAKDALQHAVALDTRSADNFLLLAHAAVESHDWDAVVEATEALLKRNDQKRNPEVYFYRGSAFYGLRDLTSARENIETAIKLDTK